MQDHSYPLDPKTTPSQLKSKIDELQEKLEQLQQVIKNTRVREKRAKVTYSKSVEVIKEHKAITTKLQNKLESYKGNYSCLPSTEATLLRGHLSFVATITLH